MVSFPAAKAVISTNAKIVAFFNSSHYWGGQLEKHKAKHNITRSLKTHTATRWYSLILQAQSVQEHRYVLYATSNLLQTHSVLSAALVELCLREDAQVNTYSIVKPDFVRTILDPAHWQKTNQLICLCKPLVDMIGNLKSCNTTLVDCMLELIKAEQKIATITIKPGNNISFI